MHPRGFIHRDIKGENVLVDEDGNVMLADFGVTAAMEPRPSESPSTSAGTSDPSVGVSQPLHSLNALLRLQHCCMRRLCSAGI